MMMAGKAGLVRNLEGHLPGGVKVALQLHGDPAPLLMNWLDEQKWNIKKSCHMNI